MVVQRYIIEHPTRGAFVEFHHSPTTGEWQPRFSYKGLRTDPCTKWWPDQASAQRMLTRILAHNRTRGAYVLQLPARMWESNRAR